MGEFDPQLVALYKVKIQNAQMRIQTRMELGKVPSTPVKAPRRDELSATQNRDKEKPGGKKEARGQGEAERGQGEADPTFLF